MYKKLVLLGALSGLMAGTASVVYQKVYAAALGADFVSIAKPAAIMLISIVSGLAAALVYWLLSIWLKARGEIVFNFIFVVVSFASIVGAFAAKLPFDIETPELFPGMVVPMHFFPALAWFTLKPLFVTAPIAFKKVFG